MRPLRIGIAVGAGALVLLLAPQPPHTNALQVAIVTAQDEPMTPESNVTSDIELLAKSLSIRFDDAAALVENQRLIDTIPFSKLDPGYAQVVSDIGPPFSVDYYSVNGKVTKVDQAFVELGLGSEVRYHSVPRSLSEMLNLVSDREFRLAVPPGAQTSLDLQRGEIVVTTESPMPVDHLEVLTQTRRPFRSEVGAVFQPALIGGRPWGACTAGFVVSETANLDRGLTTAQHCNDPGPYRGVTLSHVRGQESGSADVQLRDNNSIPAGFSPEFYDGDSVRWVESRKPYSDIDVGDVLCKHGRVTGYTCGRVYDTTICPSFIPNCNSTFVGVEPQSSDPGENQADNGDSGGPVFWGNRAWGIVVGANDPGLRMVFMPQTFFNTIDVIVTLH